MLSSVPTLTSNLITLQPLYHKTNTFAISKRSFSRNHHICFSVSPSNQNEESRWLREEERWLREEQRWLREESRWSVERQALLREIDSLKLKIQELERFGSVQDVSVSETVSSIVKLLQVVKEGDLGKNVNRIAESGSSAAPLVVETAAKEEEEIVVKEIISIPEKKEAERKEPVKRRASLRKGSEGDDVSALQEALQKLGYYSGEEEIEFSSFDTGTERAVKTWQASIGAQEDGIVTDNLWQLLFGGSSSVTSASDEHEAAFLNKSENGAPVAPITDISEVEKKVASREVRDVYDSDHRVFLLGENRWEDASRLTSSKLPVATSASGNATTKCITCRGVGHLLCMECDGTGEPNIEEQFMEWVEEGQKCPYCEGLGHVTCDLCGGAK